MNLRNFFAELKRRNRLQGRDRLRGHCVVAKSRLTLHHSLKSLAARKRGRIRSALKYWEIIADNLKKAGWSLGYVSAIDSQGRTIWIADVHSDGKRFVVHAAATFN